MDIEELRLAMESRGMMRPKDVLGTLTLDTTGTVANNTAKSELNEEAEGLQINNPTGASLQIQLYRFNVTTRADFTFAAGPQSWERLPVAPYRTIVATVLTTDPNNGPAQILPLREPPAPGAGTLAAADQSALSGAGVTAVQLTGSNAPLTAAAPKLIATIKASDITTASGITRIDFEGVLSRNARQRTFTLIQGLNEALTSFQIQPFDSSIQGNSGVGNWWGDGSSQQTSGMLSNSMGNISSVSSGDGALAANADSLSFLIGMGATLPTTGTLDIYVTELI